MTKDAFVFAANCKAIADCIDSCINNDQLACCFEMIERFKTAFSTRIDHNLLHEKSGFLYAKYHTRQAQLGIL